jgi:hypothetical protein
MHCYMGELVTRRLTEMHFNWENEAVSSDSDGQGAVQLNRNQGWTDTKKNQSTYAETTKLTSHKSIIQKKNTT